MAGSKKGVPRSRERPHVGGEMSAVELLALAGRDVNRVVFAAWARVFAQNTAREIHYPKTQADGIRKMAALYQREAKASARAAMRELAGIRTRFGSQLEWVVDPKRDIDTAALKLHKRVDWAADHVALAEAASMVSIADARYWALTQRGTGAVFYDFPPLPAPELKTVWESEQRHNFNHTPVDVKKAKVDVTLLGTTVNIGYLVFPEIDGVQPPPKVFMPSPPVTRHGVTLTALDTVGVENGNTVLPAREGHRAIRFWGYGKIIYGKAIPDGCRLVFKQVVYPKLYVGMRDEDGSYVWGDVAPGQTSGGSFGEAMDTAALGPGMAGMADLPHFDFPDAVPVCVYATRDLTFRTWVILACEGSSTLLGYWEWSFRQILHRGANGTESLERPPVGVPAPPGGWPRPGAGPTTWTDRDDAPREARADYDRHFPD